MQRQFKGRVIAPGFYRGEAVVSRQGVNTFSNISI